MTMTNAWITFRIPVARLAETRLQCHHAVQVNTLLARAFVAHREDDSHTSLMWDESSAALVGQPVPTPSGQFRLGVRLADLTLLLASGAGREMARLGLDGVTFVEAVEWLRTRVQERGLDPAALHGPFDFGLEDHPVKHGAKFRVGGNEALFEEVSAYYANAAD